MTSCLVTYITLKRSICSAACFQYSCEWHLEQIKLLKMLNKCLIFRGFQTTPKKYMKCMFQESVKTHVFKNESRNYKNNYRPVSILPLISKVFEKIMNKQLSIYFEEILSKFQCGFRKGFSTQHRLLLMLEKWKLAVDNNNNLTIF